MSARLPVWVVMACIVVASVTAQASRALAQPTAALLPAPAGDAPPELRLRAVATVREQLQTEGVRVLGADQVRQHLPPALRTCDKTDCADEVAVAMHADFVAGVAVWMSKNEPPTIAVSLVTPHADTFPGSAEAKDGNIEATTRTALADARRLQQLGPGPWIHVRGAPLGAQVLIDGKPAGVLPYNAGIAPGRHTLTVRLDGYQAAHRTVDVRLTDHDEVKVDVALEPAGGGEASASGAVAPARTAPAKTARGAPHPHTARAPLDLWGPVALGSAGVGLLAGAAVALARKGCTDKGPAGTCIRERTLRPAPFALYVGGGAAAVIGAALWYALAPHLGHRRQQRSQLELRITPTGLGITGRF